MAFKFKKEAVRGFLFLCVNHLLRLIALFSVFGLVNCASFDRTDYRQTVLVTSDPEGAAIFDGAGRPLGTTPAFVRVRRAHSPNILLKYSGQPDLKQTLPSHYRWGDSFGAGFLFLTFAPVAWTVDLITGTAWRMDDPPRFKFFTEVGTATNGDSPHEIVIAPPRAGDLETADALGPLIEEKLRRSNLGEVMHYEKSAPVFDYYGSNQGLNERKEQRYNLFYELNADHVFISTAEPKGEGYLISGQLKNIYSGEVSSPLSWEVTPADANLKQDLTRHRFFEEYFHLLPNTAFLNFANSQSNVSIDGNSYPGKSGRGHEFSEDLLNYVSFLSLAHLDRPRANVRGHWLFNFVPTLNFSDKRIVFQGYKPLQDVEFDRFYDNGGYGLEVGHLSRYGFFYLDIIPTVTWTQIHVRTDRVDEKLSRASITSMTELGYSYFLSEHFIGKLYTRTVAENQSLWERAVHDITGGSESVASVNSVFAGISIGYYRS